MPFAPRLLGPAAALLSAGAACAPPPEAPEELSELSRYLYREWAAEDERALPAGLAVLETWLDGLDLGAPVDQRSFAVLPLQEEDVAGIARPRGRRLDACSPVSIAYASRHAIEDHARLVVEADQTPAEPTAPRYDRSFEPSDPSCFVDGSCALLRTVNDVRRENALLAVEFILFKDFRWADVGEGGERRAFVARSWFEEPFYEEDGGDVLWQSYAVDVWIETPGGATRRYQALYSETEIQGLDPDFDTRGFLAGGIDDTFTAADDALDELLAR